MKAHNTCPLSNAQAKEPSLAGLAIIVIAFFFLSLFLIIPVISVFVQAVENGLDVYVKAVKDAHALSAIRLTLLCALIAVPLNVIFGVITAWAIAKFEFIGKNIFITFIELPFAVSPVIAGMIFVFLYGSYGLFGKWFEEYNIKIIFGVPGIIMATVFVTFPFIVRELIPLMQAQGTEEEEAAIILGASGWKTFFMVTLPNIKWGILYGIVLCNARAMGEFGAVSVVSGHIRGLTNTIPLHVEILYNEYNFIAAFAVASLLVMLSLVTIVLKSLVERKSLHMHTNRGGLDEYRDKEHHKKIR